MRVAALVLCVAACLGGCSTRPKPVAASVGPRASAEEITAAEKALIACHFKVLPRLDDRLSDASTIAKAVSAQCDGEGEEVFQVLARGEPSKQFNWMREAWPGAARDRALRSVLTYRAMAQDPPQRQTQRTPQDI